MTKDERIKEAQKHLTLALATNEEGQKQTSGEAVVQAAVRDCEFCKRNESNKRKLEDFRKGVLVESGWDFAWGNTGECGAFAARWWRAGGVVFPDSSKMESGDQKGTWYPIDQRTATPDDMMTVCKKWGCWLEPSQLAQVKPGDLIVTDDVSTGHAGIVESVDVQAGRVYTIEANYSGGIYRVPRTMKGIKGFGSI